MRRLAMLIALLCGCASKTAPAGPCAQRSGSYRINFTERSGNCGPIAEQIQTNVDQGMSTMMGCSGPVTTSADNCAVTIDVTCENAALGVFVEDKGVAHWSEDGATAGGIVQGTVTDSKTKMQVCSSSYDVAWTRL